MLTQKEQAELGGSYALWFVPGEWWAVSLGPDETVIRPVGPPPWPPPNSN